MYHPVLQEGEGTSYRTEPGGVFGCLGPGTPGTVSPSVTKPKDFYKINLTLLFQLRFHSRFLVSHCLSESSNKYYQSILAKPQEIRSSFWGIVWILQMAKNKDLLVQ